MHIHLKLRVGVVGALVSFLFTGLIAQYCLKQSRDDAAWLSHTHQVLNELYTVEKSVRTAERDQRGYLLTHDEKLAAHFQEMRARLAAHLARLRSLITGNSGIAGNSGQQQRLDRLEPLLDRLLRAAESDIASAGKGKANGQALIARGEEQTVDQIEICFRDLRNEEEQFLGRRGRLSQDSSLVAAWLAGTGTVLGALLIALSGIWINRDLRGREQAEASLRQVQEELEARVLARTADLSKTTESLEAEIAERRNTEAQLRQSEERYRLLFEDSPLPMEVFDPETLAYLTVNTAAAELYGYTREEFRNMTLRDIRPPGEVPAILDFLNTVKTADTYTGTFVTRHKNGRLITIEARVSTIELDGRRVRLKLLTDVTEQKRLETQLRQSQKMEAIGQLAGGVAHDFNNLLTVILGYSDTILHSIDDADPMRAKVAEIHAAGKRAANLTSQLLAFSRKQILQMQTLDVNAVISNISHMLRRLLGEDIQISHDLDSDLGQVRGDPTQLEQVLVNLAVNARDAMRRGGQLTIETTNIDLDEQSAPPLSVSPGSYVLLTVNDTGCGMDEATKAKVFEPFFTTKEVGKGTGLGLSMVLGVVQQSGGTVTVYSEVGLGTTFRIYLPQVAAPAPEPPPPGECRPLPSRAEKGRTILLVEDEDQLRTLAREVLREGGYTVLEASNAKEALRIAGKLDSPPALLLTDVVMPGMSGLELANELLKKWPGLAVVYTSGYTDHALIGRAGLEQDMPFLQKPYMPGSLLEQVADVLERPCCPVVLIVDDDKAIRDQLRTSFASAGYEVLEAADGRQAMTVVGTRPVNLVITDLVMPEADGMELIRALRRSYPEVKILALSGARDGGYLKVANTLGADGVLPKPFLQEQVMQMAEALLV